MFFFLLMSDLGNLVSISIQTIATLFTIFIAVYVLGTQSIASYKKDFVVKIENEDDKKAFNNNFDQTVESFEKLFIMISYFVFIVEASNAVIIYCLSDLIFTKFEILNLYIYIGFIIILMAIVVFSYKMISFSNSLIKDNNKPNYLIIEKFDLIYKLDFFQGVVLLGILSVSAASYFYLTDKLNYPVVPSIFICIFLGLLWFIPLSNKYKSYLFVIIFLVFSLFTNVDKKYNGISTTPFENWILWEPKPSVYPYTIYIIFAVLILLILPQLVPENPINQRIKYIYIFIFGYELSDLNNLMSS